MRADSPHMWATGTMRATHNDVTTMRANSTRGPILIGPRLCGLVCPLIECGLTLGRPFSLRAPGGSSQIKVPLIKFEKWMGKE